MAIKFDHAVKYNGKYYPAGAVIEESVQKAVKARKKAAGAKA